MTKSEILDRIAQQKVIALIRTDKPEGLGECVAALASAGMTVIELTMTTPGAPEILGRLAAEHPGILFGLGTVLEARDAEAGIDAGAGFIVTPALRPGVIAACAARGAPILAGALTPTEITQASDLGADAVKIFPADSFGPGYIRTLKSVFPRIPLVPTGGVTPQTVEEYLKAGAFATAAGTSLVDAAILRERDWNTLAARARAFAEAARFPS